ncbi:MAG TPA: ribosome-associated translation inhibitor RaiA [Roseiflexaceae bacterium]|nr:ribosome-associated translation inhibitor RaiA [Roseiflexaceae bacterium]
MELIVKSRNAKVSERQRAHIEEKMNKLARYLDQISKMTIEIAEEQRRTEGVVHRVQATLVGEHGILLRSEQRATELYAAVDEVADTLQRQIKRYKEKHWRRGKLRRQGGEIVDAAPEAVNGAAAAVEEQRPRIMRTKEFEVKPMFSDEAVEQMELLGHDFFVFRDAETSRINVLYRREDGNYGLIVPDEKPE